MTSAKRKVENATFFQQRKKKEKKTDALSGGTSDTSGPNLTEMALGIKLPCRCGFNKKL
jgi:hypothetical protein